MGTIRWVRRRDLRIRAQRRWRRLDRLRCGCGGGTLIRDRSAALTLPLALTAFAVACVEDPFGGPSMTAVGLPARVWLFFVALGQGKPCPYGCSRG